MYQQKFSKGNLFQSRASSKDGYDSDDSSDHSLLNHVVNSSRADLFETITKATDQVFSINDMVSPKQTFNKKSILDKFNRINLPKFEVPKRFKRNSDMLK